MSGLEFCRDFHDFELYVVIYYGAVDDSVSAYLDYRLYYFKSYHLFIYN